MSVAVVFPYSSDDESRERAFWHVRGWWVQLLPDVEMIIGACDDAWSKGAAIAAGVARTDATTIVLADADSFIMEPHIMRHAVDRVVGGAPWAMPHGIVVRLNAEETDRVIDGTDVRPNMGMTARPAYHGVDGGGIVVLTRAAYDTVNGVDPRFLGWGGEDVALAAALTTLVAPPLRLKGHLIHLWHPHPAPDLRGPPASEDLVARYRAARDYPRRMQALCERVEPEPTEQLAEPVKFWGMGGRSKLKLSDGTLVHFKGGIHATTDPDTRDALRRAPGAREILGK